MSATKTIMLTIALIFTAILLMQPSRPGAAQVPEYQMVAGTGPGTVFVLRASDGAVRACLGVTNPTAVKCTDWAR